MPAKTISSLQVIMAAAALIIWLAGAYTAQQAAGMANGVLIRFESGGVSPAELNRQEDYFRQDRMRNMPDATIWRDVMNQNVSGEGEYNTAGVTVTEISGDIHDVCQSRLLSGGYPQKGDNEGCVIGDKLAFAMWNGAEVIGMPVYWDGRLYYIRGVVRDDEKILLAQANISDATTYPYMRLRFPEGGGREEAQTYLNKAGFTGAEMLDLPVLAYGLELLAFFPALLLVLSALVKIIRQAVRLFSFPALIVMYLPMAAIGSVFCVRLAAYAPNIPDRLVPGKWSDFEFIGRMFTDMINRIRSWLAAPATSDLTLWGKVLTAAVLLAVALALTAAVTGRIRVTTPKQWGLAVFGSLAVMFAVVAVFSGNGGLIINSGMWLAPTLWVSVDFGINCFNRWVTPEKAMAEEADLMIVDIDTLEVEADDRPEPVNSISYEKEPVS